MPYPDNFNATGYHQTWGRDFVPPPTTATAADLVAIRAVRDASAAYLAALRRHPWTFDCVETVSHADHVAEHAAAHETLERAVREVEGVL